tara:strand:- start:144 stop:368 length:225 start_codon:yes stop_codon:yes gene_type:complete
MDKYQELQSLLLNGDQAARLCGMSKASWYRLNGQGLTPRPIGLLNNQLWSRDELREWCEAGCPDRTRWNNRKKD